MLPVLAQILALRSISPGRLWGDLCEGPRCSACCSALVEPQQAPRPPEQRQCVRVRAPRREAMFHGAAWAWGPHRVPPESAEARTAAKARPHARARAQAPAVRRSASLAPRPARSRARLVGPLAPGAPVANGDGARARACAPRAKDVGGATQGRRAVGGAHLCLGPRPARTDLRVGPQLVRVPFRI